MIPRYTTKEMGKIWGDENKFAKWLEVEKAVASAQAELGMIPEKAAEDINKKSRFDIKKIEEIESKTHHDVVAFLTDVSSHLGDSSKYLHYGLTSSDVGDTALSLQILDAVEVVEKKIIKFGGLLKEKAKKYAHTVMVGRTHGIHAEPVTLGLKFTMYAFEMSRNLERLKAARQSISYGKISGAVGTYANTGPQLEEKVCGTLGLRPAPVSTQILQRDRHAQLISALAITGATLEKLALEVRNLQRTDVKEVEEPFAKGQKGSSAMPHKKNPILCERICGLARVLRSNTVTAMENIVLWHERDISHSSAERVIIPDSFAILDYILDKAYFVIDGLGVAEDNMKRNLMKYGGIIFSQRVLLALIDKGMDRHDAYMIVQSTAHEAWNEEGSFRENISKDKKVAGLFNPQELEELFDYNYHLRFVDEIIDRLNDI
ncbi:MAG: adenylosuccinate lyase [Actinomycetota bacterium]|nr:MAG: adenylosuccinate lyase [Actinomycetota bacterium]